MITIEQLKDVKERTEALYRYLDIEGKKIQVEEEQLRTQAPGFWDDQKTAEAQMKKVKGLENGLNLPKHMAEHIYMFTGESAAVTFRAKKYLVSEIIDWFGKDIKFSDETEDEVTVRVMVNLEAMRKWALQYAVHVKILSPGKLVDMVKEDIKKASEQYKGEH